MKYEVFTNTAENMYYAVSKKLLVFVLPFFSYVSQAQDSTAFTLQQAQDYAVKNSPLVKNAQVDIKIYQQKVKEITALGLPQINAEGTFNHFLNIPTTVVPASAFSPGAPADLLVPVQFGTKFQTSAGVTLTQLIFDGSYIVGIRSTKSITELQLLLEQKAQIDVQNEIAKAYYMAAVANENTNTLTSTLTNLEKLKVEISAINKEGLMESQDVEQLELTLEGMRNNISRANNMKKMAFNLLKLNMGIDISKEITITETINQLSAAFNSGDYGTKEFVPSQIPEYKIMLMQKKISEYSLDNERAKYLPSFGAFITHSYNLPSNKMDQFDNRRWFPTTIWGLKLTVPIFSSGMRMARVQQARLTLEKSVNDLSNAQNALKLQAESAKLNFSFALENQKAMKNSLELADRIQQKILIKYKEGVSSSMELNQAQMQYLSAQANYINSIYTVLTSKAEMDKAYGLLQPSQTNLPDPKK